MVVDRSAVNEAGSAGGKKTTRGGTGKQNNMIQLQDVIQFYIGCDCIRPDNKTVLKIYGVQGNLIVHNEPDGLTYSGTAGCKPILRNLSDMTTDEMKDMYHLVFGRRFCGDNITHRDVGKKNERWVLWSGVERLFIYKDGDIGADSDLQHRSVHQPSVFKFLLSKQFDLFGLIESKQAVDAATISKQQ